MPAVASAVVLAVAAGGCAMAVPSAAMMVFSVGASMVVFVGPVNAESAGAGPHGDVQTELEE